MSEFAGKERIIQEFVPGKQVTLAHVIANPDKNLYGKLGVSSRKELLEVHKYVKTVKAKLEEVNK